MKPITRAILLSGLAALALAAGLAAWSGERQTHWVFTDGADLRVATDLVKPRQTLWQSPMPLLASIDTDANEYEPRISGDGLMLLFVRGKPGENADIFVCTRDSPNAWSDPQPLTDINTEADELGPELSADGNTLYFCSDRQGGRGDYDLWRSMRTGSGWSAPENLGPAINTSWNEHNPALSSDGLMLFFASNRPRPGESNIGDDPAKRWSATLRDNVRVHDFDLYSAPMANAEIGEPAPVAALNTPANEGTPSMSPAGDFLYFSSDRAGGQGGFDLYRSRWLRGQWLPPENLGVQINTQANELDPSLSMGGFALHLSSDRAMPTAGDQDHRQYDLFASVSKEVFEEKETVGDGINWASLLATVLPNLLWLLLGLLLVLLFLRFVRSGKMSALSLLTRCILLSLLAHVLLMMLFMIWGVTVGLADAIKRGGSTQVGLVSSSVGQGQGQGIVSQIRGEMTQAMLMSAAPSSEKQAPAASLDESTMLSVRLADETRPVKIADGQLIRANSSADAPVPAEQAAMNASVDVPSDQPRAVETRVPAAAAANASDEAEAKTPEARVRPSSRSSTNIVMDAPRDAAVQTSPGRVSPTVLNNATQQGSMASALEMTDAASVVESPAAPSSIVAVDKPSPMTEISLPRAERPGGGGASGEAQAIVAGSTPMSGRATGTSTLDPTDSSTGDGAVIVQGSANSPVQIDRGGASLASTSVGSVADASPSMESPDNETGRTIGVPSPAQSDALAGLRTPAESSGSSSRITSGESQAQIGAPAGGDANQSGKVESLTTPDASSAAGGHVVTETSGALGSSGAGASLADDKRSLAMTNLAGALNDAAGPSSLGFSGSDAGASLIPALPGDSTGIKLPTETAPPVEAYKQRAPQNRLELVKEKGGSEATERAVELALKWLAAHQSADGRWDADHFDDGCGRCGNPAKFDADVATTGLALLCFMAANHTHTQDGPYRSVVQRGLNWLVSEQKDTGDLRGNETMYSHGIGSIALSEAYGMTRDQQLLPHVRRAIGYIVKARDSSGRDGPPASGGWRYEPGQAGDTSVLGWQVMAMVSASRAGIDVPADALQAARNWLDRVSTSNNPGLYSYQPGERFSVTMTAEGMFAQQLLGRGHDEPRMINSADFITRTLPNWRSEPNTYYWYYATLALFQHQGEEWEKWNMAITKELLDNQHTTGARAGSWDPLDRWSKIGGRIYQTALCTLSLEVYYRYLPLYGPHASAVEQAP